MKSVNKISANIASSLLEIEAVKINVSNPFTWASGIKSPIYCDNRRILSYPALRSLVAGSMVELSGQQFGVPDCIAGVATGGIAHGVLVADILKLPFVYVRSGNKEHGLGNLVEGVLHPGWRVLVVEDLVSTGKSSLSVVENIRQNECEVSGMIAIFTYGFESTGMNFRKAGCELITLTNYDILIDVAKKQGYINSNETGILEKWRQDPRSWH